MTNLDNSSKEAIVDLLPYYVYELRDPRDNTVFYVGKGKKNRVNHHGNNLIQNDTDDVDDIATEKLKDSKIREIGYEKVNRVIIARFETEDEAFAVEAILIKWVYGFENLTNLVHGHRHRNMRNFKEHFSQEYTQIRGLDIPKNLPGYSGNGEYTDDLRRKISDNAIVEKLESLREFILESESFTHFNISTPDCSVPQDPCLIISGFTPTSVNIQVKMQLSGKNIVLNLIPVGPSQADRSAFIASITTNINESYAYHNGNRFGLYVQTHDFVTSGGGMPRGVPYSDFPMLKKCILQTLLRLCPHP